MDKLVKPVERGGKTRKKAVNPNEWKKNKAKVARAFGDCVTFSINGVVQKVQDLPPNTSLLVYIRDYAHLKGTKFMCREGGCGSCIVNLTDHHPVTGELRSYSVNACLYLVFSCHGKYVTTVEGLRRPDGCHNPIQERLAHFYGTQCGFCSPGWVMSMYSLLKSKPSLTMKEIEESLGSNVCRCTGYRPILDAFKSFASDSSDELRQKLVDIEELKGTCSKNGCCPQRCQEVVGHSDDITLLEFPDCPPCVQVTVGGCSTWYRVETVAQIFQIIEMNPESYMLVAGNTGQGVFENKYRPPPEVYIDIGGVSELQRHWLEDGYLHLGGNMTYTDTIYLFERLSQTHHQTFQYLRELALHIKKIAHIPVRNVGTLAGGLIVKHMKRSFESDSFTIFEAAGAKLKIVSSLREVEVVTFPEFLDLGLTKKVITEVILPPLDSRCYVLRTFKIAKIFQNAHAYINAGYLFKLDNNYKILDRPRIVYGGVAPSFIHASKTEEYLEGKLLVTNNTLQGGLEVLDKEIIPERELPQSSNEYRKRLSLALLYKFVLNIGKLLVSPKYRSGGEELKRPLSSGRQEFSTDPSLYPVNKPMPKLEALLQCSGEAEYSYDVPLKPDELFAALVIADRGPAVLEGVDASPALAIDGVVAFFSAKDIPGKNAFLPYYPVFIVKQELLFAEKMVEYAGQAVGVIVARSQDLADCAASRVVIQYSMLTKPKMTVQEVLEAGEVERLTPSLGQIVPTQVKADVRYSIKDTFSAPPQYHYAMETNVCVVRPTAQGLDVFVSTQAVIAVIEGVAICLGIPSNSINITVRRCGGAFGNKITRPSLPACACALAAYLLRRPVRIYVNMQTQMQALGTRKPTYYNYEVDVNEEGVIQRLVGEYYDNVGNAPNEEQGLFTMGGLKNVYDASTWAVTAFNVKTDRPMTCWMRAPGTITAYMATENLMEHISTVVGKDPFTVRMNNLSLTTSVTELIDELIKKADYEERKENCRKFNSENLWKKRGIALLPMKFDLIFFGNSYALISIYRNDGSVVVSHGGIEIGQGINTQAAQTCAAELKVPLHYIHVQPADYLFTPNNIPTGGSISGDSVTLAVMKCCKILNDRLDPVRQEMDNPTWIEMINEAYNRNINLNAVARFDYLIEGRIYETSGVSVSEVEVDCLTGEHQVVRIDVLEDAGQSVNQYIDIGQVEGSLVMGMGYCTSEELIYDERTGRLLTDRSWEYKVPQAKDIPIDMRVHLKPNSINKVGPTRAKAISEPPMLLSYSIISALRMAIRSVRSDLGYGEEFFKLETPATRERIFLTCDPDYKQYLLRQ